MASKLPLKRSQTKNRLVRIAIREGVDRDTERKYGHCNVNSDWLGVWQAIQRIAVLLFMFHALAAGLILPSHNPDPCEVFREESSQRLRGTHKKIPVTVQGGLLLRTVVEDVSKQ